MSDEKKIDDGGPAFPVVDSAEQGMGVIAKGMTLLDWFAGRALEGMCAFGKPVEVNGVMMPHDEAAYALAQQMIVRRKQYVG